MLKPFDFCCGYSKVVSLFSDDVSPPVGDSRRSDVIRTSYCNHDIISSSSARLLLLKWLVSQFKVSQIMEILYKSKNWVIKCMKWSFCSETGRFSRRKGISRPISLCFGHVMSALRCHHDVASC